MATALTVSGDRAPVLPDHGEDMPELGGLRLRIFDHIEAGFGVVPIVGDDAGSHMLKNGEVAVYDENWRDDPNWELTPGLYCMEHQRLPGGMHPETAGRMAIMDRRMVRTRNEREVVFVSRHPRSKDGWAYRELRSRLHRGVRLPARLEGPIYPWAMPELLLGPIVGIFRPNLAEAA